VNYKNIGVKLKPKKLKKKDNPLSTRKGSSQNYVCACVKHFFLIPLTGLRNAEEATFLKIRYVHKENEMIILKFYIFWLCGDINVRHKINYQLFLIISAKIICSI
jgi:hypothetical protein